MLKSYGVPIERLNKGKPIIAPKDNWWENGAASNAAAFYLERSATNDSIIKKLISQELTLDDPKLENGVVAVHYRSIPKKVPGEQRSLSYVGLALFTPEVELLKRYAEPVILPSENPQGYDYLGVEDVRITRIGDNFYA